MKLRFDGKHISPWRGCCKTWIGKWNWKCKYEWNNHLIINGNDFIHKKELFWLYSLYCNQSEDGMQREEEGEG